MTESENLEKAQELYNLADKWVNCNFNFIQLNVLEKMAGEDGLYSHIREVLEPQDFYREASAEDQKRLKAEYKAHIGKRYFHADHDQFLNFLIEEKADEIRDFQQSSGRENYPMWNTCFEFRTPPIEEVVKAAAEVGFGIIEGMDDFNTTLFVSGAGYSFYGQHWIPLFLELPWNSELKKKYKGVKFNMM